MDENTARPLQYGHVGKPIYSSGTQSWSFSRTLCPAPRISYTGITKTVVRSPSTSIPLSSTLKRSTLTQVYPELTGGYHSTYNQGLSHMITVTGEVCRPLTSTLLEFGRAVVLDVDHSGQLSVPIAVFASGECGNMIAFRTVADGMMDTLPSTTVEIRAPTIGDEDTFEWVTEGAPVRQICSSTIENDGASFVAARSSSTVIFRPLYRRTSASIPTQRGISGVASNYQVSRLDPNFLMEISSSHTGGFAHADVKFNPWNQNQIAIVDEGGNWGIWQLRNQLKKNKDNWIATRVAWGSLPCVGAESQATGADSRHDGWLAIEWVGDGRHIIVCDRRCSMLYRMENGHSYSSTIELGLRRKSEWILGIRRSTCNPSQVFVLTTYRLLWLDVAPALTSAHGNLRSPVSPRLSWRHFRDSDDTTLQLTSLAVDEDFYLILFSRLSPLLLAFNCPISADHTTDSGSAPDPFILHIPQSPEDPGPLSGAVHFSTLVFKQIAPANLDITYRCPGLSFIKAFLVDSNLRVQESVYSKISNSTLEGEPTRERDILRATDPRVSKSPKQAFNDRSDFIVDDWGESALGPGTSPRGIHNIAPLLGPQFTLDYTQIYAIVTGALGLLSCDGGEGAGRSFRALVQELINEISDHDPLEHPTSRTAPEILQRTPIFDDIDQNAQDLRLFISQFASDHLPLKDTSHLLVHPFNPLTSPASHRVLAETSKLDLIAIYDRLVNHWLVDLPFNISGRARIAKEKAIRHLMADMVLGQIIAVRRADSTIQSTDGESLASSRPISDLRASLAAANEQLSYEATGPSTKAGSIAIRCRSRQGNFVFPNPLTGEVPTFTSLSAYTSFRGAEPISRDTHRILGHWKLGLDQVSYSIVTEESQSAARLKGSRCKPRNKMSLSLKPLNLESSAPLPAASSPVRPSGDWGSQPDNNSQPPMIRLQSSQVTEDLLPMTQVERGAFGGREAVKKSVAKAKKKKRAAGF
ncbi:RNA polymerase I-specific transcription initiation factor RRN6-like protein [Aspergillus pseudoustus]|uniref:RNA polymerase I-specific transcription initiation factor RRN6-like protein n=1 Tax=Aspergillus pseudoustus TaxID=1810923 RepID=A0ABR4JBJ9_9EURO